MVDAIALRDSRPRTSDNIGAAMEEYALSEWEPVDEQYYEYNHEQEVDFVEGVFGEQYICEGSSSLPVNSEGNSSQLERFTDQNQASIQDLEHRFGSMEKAEMYVSEIHSAASQILR